MARFRGSCRNKIATNQFLIPFLGNLSYSVLKSFPRGEYNVIGIAFFGMGWLRPILDLYMHIILSLNFSGRGGLSDCNTDFINGMTIIKFVHVGV